MSKPYDDQRQPDAGCQFCSVLDDEMPDACEGCRHKDWADGPSAAQCDEFLGRDHYAGHP